MINEKQLNTQWQDAVKHRITERLFDVVMDCAGPAHKHVMKLLQVEWKVKSAMCLGTNIILALFLSSITRCKYVKTISG